MRPYSKEFRGQVLVARDKGRSTREVATYINVSESRFRRIKQESREVNKIAPCLTRRRTPLCVALADQMLELIRHKPDLTLRLPVYVSKADAFYSRLGCWQKIRLGAHARDEAASGLP